MMNEIERKRLIQEAESLMEQYCDGCFLYKTLRSEKGRRIAHKFCIDQCTIGEKLKEYGNQLNNEHPSSILAK